MRINNIVIIFIPWNIIILALILTLILIIIIKIYGKNPPTYNNKVVLMSGFNISSFTGEKFFIIFDKNKNQILDTKSSIYYNIYNKKSHNINLDFQITEMTTPMHTPTSISIYTSNTNLIDSISDLVFSRWDFISSWFSFSWFSISSSLENISYSHSSIPIMNIPYMRLPKLITNPELYLKNNVLVLPIVKKDKIDLGNNNLLYDLYYNSNIKVVISFILIIILLPYVINIVNIIIDNIFTILNFIFINPIFILEKKIINWFTINFKNFADNNEGDITSLYNIIKNYKGSNGKWDISSIKKAAFNNYSNNGNGGDDGEDDRDKNKFFIKDYRIFHPFLLRMLEIIRQIMSNYIPIFSNSLMQFQVIVESLNSMNIINITERLLLNSFENIFADFYIRIWEAWHMLFQEIERLREFIINNITSSIFDSTFILLETELEVLRDTIILYTNNIYRQIRQILRYNRSRNIPRLLNNLQLIRISNSITVLSNIFRNIFHIIRDFLNL